MLTAYEQRLVLSYLVNAVRHLQRGTSETKALLEWVSENSGLLWLRSSLVDLRRERARRGKSKGRRSTDQSGDLQDRLADGGCGRARRVRADRLALRLGNLGREMQLTRIDVAILEVMLRYRSNPVIESLIDAVFDGGRHFRKVTGIFNVRCPTIRASSASRARLSSLAWSQTPPF